MRAPSTSDWDNAKFPVLHGDDYRFRPGLPDVLRAGRAANVFACGSVVHEAVAAGETLAEGGCDIGVVSMPSIRPMDRESVSRLLRFGAHRRLGRGTFGAWRSRQCLG